VAIFLSIGDWWWGRRFTQTKFLTIEAPNGAKAIITTKGFDAPNALFYDSDGVTRLELGLTQTGEPFVRLLGADGARIAGIDTTTRSGDARVFVRDSSGSFVVWPPEVGISPPDSEDADAP